MKEGRTGNIQSHYILKRNWCKINFKDEQVIVDGCLWEWNWVLRVSEDPLFIAQPLCCSKFYLCMLHSLKTFLNVHFLEM